MHFWHYVLLDYVFLWSYARQLIVKRIKTECGIFRVSFFFLRKNWVVVESLQHLHHWSASLSLLSVCKNFSRQAITTSCVALVLIFLCQWTTVYIQHCCLQYYGAWSNYRAAISYLCKDQKYRIQAGNIAKERGLLPLSKKTESGKRSKVRFNEYMCIPSNICLVLQ